MPCVFRCPPERITSCVIHALLKQALNSGSMVEGTCLKYFNPSSSTLTQSTKRFNPSRLRWCADVTIIFIATSCISPKSILTTRLGTHLGSIQNCLNRMRTRFKYSHPSVLLVPMQFISPSHTNGINSVRKRLMLKRRSFIRRTEASFVITKHIFLSIRLRCSFTLKFRVMIPPRYLY